MSFGRCSTKPDTGTRHNQGIFRSRSKKVSTQLQPLLINPSARAAKFFTIGTSLTKGSP